MTVMTQPVLMPDVDALRLKIKGMSKKDFKRLAGTIIWAMSPSQPAPLHPADSGRLIRLYDRLVLAFILNSDKPVTAKIHVINNIFLEGLVSDMGDLWQMQHAPRLAGLQRLIDEAHRDDKPILADQLEALGFLPCDMQEYIYPHSQERNWSDIQERDFNLLDPKGLYRVSVHEDGELLGSISYRLAESYGLTIGSAICSAHDFDLLSLETAKDLTPTLMQLGVKLESFPGRLVRRKRGLD